MKVMAFALDLKDDESLIEEYIRHHQNVWPEVIEGIKMSGILKMEIFRFSTRLFMRIEVEDDFSLEEKARLDRQNEGIQEWEALMWRYQKLIEGGQPGEKWVLMQKVFEL